MKMKIISLMIVLLLVNIIPVSAVNGPPVHAFYGTASGSTVTAQINGVEVESGSIINGQYGYGSNSFKIVDNTGNLEGDTIAFFVDGQKANQEAIFEYGGDTRLDLTVLGQATDGGTTTTGDGGGGGGGGRGTTGEETEETPTPGPENIGTTESTGEGEGETITPFGGAEDTEGQGFFQRILNFITGAVVGPGGSAGDAATVIIVLLLILVVISLIVYIFYKRRKKK